MPKRTAEQAIADNRRAKAERLYQAMSEAGITMDHIREFRDSNWETIALLCGYGHISDECRGLVIGMFQRRAA